MLGSLGKIQNPLLRIITAASTSLAMVTLIAAVAIGLNNPKDKSANQVGVYASLLAFVAGAGIGLVVRDNSQSSVTSTKSQSSSQDTAQDTWKDWRNFKIVKKEPESKEITSFYFQPEDGGKFADFKPGQFLTIKLDIPEQNAP